MITRLFFLLTINLISCFDSRLPVKLIQEVEFTDRFKESYGISKRSVED